MAEYNTNIFKSDLDVLGINLTEKQIEQFLKYYELFVEWNSFMNLTAITDFDEVCKKHFVDSVSLIKVMDLSKEISVIDIGTGAGFPGIPLKIAFPELKITLLDSLGKRVNFLNTVINELGLKGITAIHARAEDGGRDKKLREKFDCVTARAVAPMNILLEYCMPFVKKDGVFIAMKGASEEDCFESALKELSGSVISEDVFNLPESDFTRRIICIKKTNFLSTKYPRKAGIPKKNPL